VTSFCEFDTKGAGHIRPPGRCVRAPRRATPAAGLGCDDVHGCVGLFRCHSVNGLQLDAHTRVVDATEY
jgi:hypothetical protein